MGGIAPPSPARALHNQGENSRARARTLYLPGMNFIRAQFRAAALRARRLEGRGGEGAGGKELDWAGLVCRAAGGPGQAGAACGGGGRGGGGGPDSGGPRQHTTALTIIHPHQPGFVFV